MSNNHLKPDAPNPRRLGNDPFGDVQDMIQAAVSPDAARSASSAEASRATPADRRAPGDRAGLRGQAVPSGLAQGASLVACPYLGVVQDPHTRFLQPDAVHRCFGTQRSTTIDLDFQTEYCLTAQFASCDTYMEVQERDISAQEKSAGGLKGFLARLFRRE